jgi:uncharacterized protein with HEPN domain
MELDINVWLNDILQAIKEIESFLPEKKIFEEFKKDLKTKRAVERNLEIIGEATNRILAVNSTINITASRKIVDTRNRIAQGYDSVSDEIIWSIILRDLPTLKDEIALLIKNQ